MTTGLRPIDGYTWVPTSIRINQNINCYYLIADNTKRIVGAVTNDDTPYTVSYMHYGFIELPGGRADTLREAVERLMLIEKQYRNDHA